ncbi:hypothetical protein GCM10023196_035920 [Actinoallomurus vinaceus]|uniref:Uncharacterized protein n=1 Tax=Actinoallomurus vinaceus TaxID=1080074 RepID=A0ABP8UBQ7_9ACTN
MAAQPAACLLHADIHVMEQTCWNAAIDWYAAHWDMPPAEQRNAYQAAVERRMLDQIRIGHAVDHAVRPAIDRAIERDHSLCGAEPCSDCR